MSGGDSVTLAALPPRLEAVVRFVPAGARVLDVGTDHAYLPIALLRRGTVPWAIGADVRPGPLDQARVNRDQADLSDARLELRLGDGLAAVRPGEVDVAVLAGMGGLLMRRLLVAEPAVLGSLRRLILAPNNHVAEVRRWADDAGYKFLGEDLVAEGRHLYPVLALEATTAGGATSGADGAHRLTNLEAELGPLLLRQGHPLVPVLARRLLTQTRHALTELEQAGTASGRSAERREALAKRVQELEEVLACWPKWPG